MAAAERTGEGRQPTGEQGSPVGKLAYNAPVEAVISAQPPLHRRTVPALSPAPYVPVAAAGSRRKLIRTRRGAPDSEPFSGIQASPVARGGVIAESASPASPPAEAQAETETADKTSF